MRSKAPPESSPYPQLQMWLGRKRSLPPTWDESPPSLWLIEYDSYCSMAHQYQMHILAILLIILVNIYTSVRTFLCVHLNSTELSSLMSSTIDLISHITGQEPEILRERFWQSDRILNWIGPNYSLLLVLREVANTLHDQKMLQRSHHSPTENQSNIIVSNHINSILSPFGIHCYLPQHR